IKIFTGSANRPLAEAIGRYIDAPLGQAEIGRFSDGEVQVEITENVRGGDVFVIQSICTPGNDHLMELLLMLDAFKRASARRITAVVPYYGYARQDRKVAPRVPISAKLVADVITTAGAARVLTVDLHALGGGGGGAGRGSAARARLRDPPGALRPRHPAPRPLEHRRAHRHRHHSAPPRGHEARQAARPLGRAAPRRGDPPHARGGLHQLTLHLKDDRLWTWSRSPSSAARVRA